MGRTAVLNQIRSFLLERELKHLKAEYIGADRLPFYFFRLQLYEGPYIPIIRLINGNPARHERSTGAGMHQQSDAASALVSEVIFRELAEPC